MVACWAGSCSASSATQRRASSSASSSWPPATRAATSVSRAVLRRCLRSSAVAFCQSSKSGLSRTANPGQEVAAVQRTCRAQGFDIACCRQPPKLHGVHQGFAFVQGDRRAADHERVADPRGCHGHRATQRAPSTLGVGVWPQHQRQPIPAERLLGHRDEREESDGLPGVEMDRPAVVLDMWRPEQGHVQHLAPSEK